MTHLAYLSVLMLSLGGLGLADWRWRLALFADVRQTLQAIAAGVILFTAWDLAGIALGIFFPGRSPFVTGVLLVTGYPLEELVFLTLLSYLALLLFRVRRSS